MNLIKTAIRENSFGIFCTRKASLFTVLLKRKFSEFYDIRQYRKQATEQLVVKTHAISYQKITVNEEK